MPEHPVLLTVPATHALVEFRLELPRRRTHARVALTIVFSDGSTDISLRLLQPYPLDAAFNAVDGACGVQVLDVSADQWEEKKVKLEFLTGEGQREEVWAE